MRAVSPTSVKSSHSLHHQPPPWLLNSCMCHPDDKGWILLCYLVSHTCALPPWQPPGSQSYTHPYFSSQHPLSRPFTHKFSFAAAAHHSFSSKRNILQLWTFSQPGHKDSLQKAQDSPQQLLFRFPATYSCSTGDAPESHPEQRQKYTKLKKKNTMSTTTIVSRQLHGKLILKTLT